ncbi:type I polyketide synthase WcbR [Legionella nautarum]|uniref:Type I polyketide synthase WcbR n=1 Tax=Legionella nautarum TaxID=45070 RepID=A0A0W0WYR1_9GAMM|nr:hybrid non-ribosomal peptide synthetase/type I polyketide synthase [Legionella nautarum]KTD37472.1 type I polyketide synthase WcbR [Legionella nautarum]
MKQHSPISIIGMACEFAGQADSLANFYKVILEGVDATSDISEGRWNVDLDSLPQSIRHGGFLKRNPWSFDAQFFAISPKEAAHMDPQHRILLEQTYHALEDTNLDLDTIKGSNCGVFIGLGTQDYSRIMHNSGQFSGLHSKGSLGSMAAGRIAYHFDLIGPNFVVDTACSSSLVALDQAVKALQDHRCDLAIVGGVTLILTTDYNTDLASANLLAKDGRCKPFSKGADGFARGEGVGVIILQRRQEALRDKRRIYANILGSAINSDGKTNGITAPSKESQKRVIQDALKDAQISAQEVNFIETHGTGTDLGDKIEFAALIEIYQGREEPLYIGSVKGNIAHCEAAAGIAGVIKTSLCIYHDLIPPHTAANFLNPDLRVASLKAQFPAQVLPKRNIVGTVSSFGMSGANAEVVLADEPTKNAAASADCPQVYPYLLLSAKSAESLHKLGSEYRLLLEHCEEEAFNKCLSQANLRNNCSGYRKLVYGQDKTALLKQLDKIDLTALKKRMVKGKTKFAFMFTGQGAVFKEMTRVLYDRIPLYRNILNDYAAKMDDVIHLPHKIISYIFNDEFSLSLDDPQTAQLSLFLIEFSLARLLNLLGITPDFVVGHSLGEYAAACSAGILSFEQAVQMVNLRSQAIKEEPGLQDGLMLQIYATNELVQKLLAELRLKNPLLALWISVNNAPEIQVVSGNKESVLQLTDLLKQKGIPYLKLNTSHAFHTPCLELAATNFKDRALASAMSFTLKNSITSFISTAEPHRDDNQNQAFASIDYWAAQIVKPVRFVDAIESCYELGVRSFIEIGPDSILTNLARQCLKNKESSAELEFIAMNSKNKNNLDSLFSVLNYFYSTHRLDGSKLGLLDDKQRVFSSFFLPVYPFARVELLPDYLKNSRVPAVIEKNNSKKIRLEPTHLEFQINLDLSQIEHAYIAQHVIHEMCILPGSYYIATSIQLLETFKESYLANQPQTIIELDNLLIMHPVIISQSGQESLKVTIHQQKPNQYKFSYFCLAEIDQLVCEMTLLLKSYEEPNCVEINQGTKIQDTSEFYSNYAVCGVNYGPLFKKQKSYYNLDSQNIISELEAAEGYFTSHAAFIDNCFQTMALGLNQLGSAFAPTAVNQFKFYKEEKWGVGLGCHAQIIEQKEGHLEANLKVYNAQNKVVMEINGIVCKSIQLDALSANVIHKVALEKIAVSAPDNSLKDFAFLANFKTEWVKPESILAWSDLQAKTTIDVRHLIIGFDGLAWDKNELFSLFQCLFNFLRLQAEKISGNLKVISFLSLNDKAKDYKKLLAPLLKAMTLAFPTEFPNLSFRHFSYTKLTKDNIAFLFAEDKELPTDHEFLIPFWEVYGNELYRYKTIPQKPNQAEPLPKEGYYLITGGLGGIGKTLVRHMVSNLGCRNLILTYRKLEPEAEQFITELNDQYDANIRCHHVDLRSESQLVKLFATLPRPLYGIFHLAGIIQDQSLAKTSPHSIENVLAAKLFSAWTLHELSQEITELKAFVLFSSLATLISSPGQFNYALANLGLQELAAHRKNSHLPVSLIDWGPWANIGMMANSDSLSASSIVLSKFVPLSPTICHEALFSCLNQTNDSHFAVFKMNKREPIVRTSVESETKISLNPHSSKKEAAQFIKALLLRLIAQETNHASASIDEHLILSELGLDSINTIRIRAELQTELNLAIPLSILLEETTLERLVDQVLVLWLANQNNQNQHSESNEEASVNRGDANFFSLSYNQFSIWYEQHAIENNQAYHCSIGWKIRGGDLNLKQVYANWEVLISRHEMLRALFSSREGNLGYELLSVSQALEQQMVVVETIEADRDPQQYLQNYLLRKIDFNRELPTKVLILSHQNDVYLMLSSHHIVMDAAAMFYLGKKLLTSLCEADYVLDKDFSSQPYHEFTKQQFLQSAEFDLKTLSFLRKEVLNEEGELRVFELPKKSNTGILNLAKGATKTILFSEMEMQIIQSLPASIRVHLCLSAWALLLAKYSGEENLLIGVAFNGRTQKKWTEVVGHFVNVLPLCIKVNQHQASNQFINEIKSRLIELLEFQDFPLVKLMKDPEVKQALQGRPLLQTYFNYFDASDLDISVNNQLVTIDALVYPQQEAQFEMSLWVTRTSRGFDFEVKYQRELFSETMLEKLVGYYKTVLIALSQALLQSNTQLKLAEIQFLSETELAKRLPPESTNRPSQLVYNYFAEQAASLPQSVAIEMREQNISYQSLQGWVDELALALTEFPQSKDETVAIIAPERANIEFIVTVLALWKQGFAFVPLNSHHPFERIKYVLDTVGCRKLILVDVLSPNLENYICTNNKLLLEVRIEFPQLQIQVLNESIPEENDRFENRSQANPSDLAYILFTSGSTGLPKGVLIEQEGLIDRLLWMKNYFNFSAADKFLQSTLLTFDVSLPEYCLPLICGATIVLFHPEESQNAHAALCTYHQVTMMSTVPSLFSILLSDLAGCPTLKHLIMIGEVLPRAIVNKWLASNQTCTLYNLYGPTEVTVYASAHACREPINSALVPIGEAADNVIPLVLDQYGNPVLDEVIGELYLAGSGVARGYIGGQLKSDPFINNPWQSLHYTRMYKTGDFVRWLEGGRLEYIGRKDNRIKLNGLLVELGEIEERVLKAFPDLENACAIITEFKIKETLIKHIVLCIMPECTDSSIIMEHLKQHLPQYMLPWKIISYAEFPRNSSAKVDRKLLTNLVKELYEEESVQAKLRPKSSHQPVTFMEKEICKIWETLLQKSNLGIDENFFELGGDSLLLTQMILLVEKQLGIKTNFAKFLANPSINSLLHGLSMESPIWENEFKLLKAISPYQEVKKTKAVLLTGGTGHLGIHLLRSLLNQTDKQIYLIIRAESKTKAIERLTERYFSVFGDSLALNRLCIYSGDLALLNFGLEEADFQKLCQEISLIIHAAAEVNHVVDYVRLKKSNVLVSKNMLDLARSAHCTHFFHISTQFSELSILPESYMNETSINEFSSGYEQSKFIAESLMSAAKNLKYPVTTLRLPLIIDDSDPLLLRQNHFVAFVMKCLRLGAYPDIGLSFALLATADLADFVAELSNKSYLEPEVYNCHTRRISLQELFDFFITETEYKVNKLEPSLWKARVLESTYETDPFYKLLPLYTSSLLISENVNEQLIEHKGFLKAIETTKLAVTDNAHIKKIGSMLANYSRL